jgi:hypothetical protein
MKKQFLARLYLDLNNLFYRLFDSLNEQEKIQLRAALDKIQHEINGEF